jgi:regulation of enolase protein 1 (concanavalin A-like superfamily)
MGVRSQQDDFHWLRIYRALDDNGQVIVASSNKGQSFEYNNSQAYTEDIVYLKIERRNNNFYLSYSSDSNSWSPLLERTFDLPDSVEIFLTTFSTGNNEGISAKFEDLTVIR